MHTCDSTEFSSSICSSNSTKYLYAGLIYSNINIPKNATITAASITVACTTPAGSSGSETQRIRGIYKASNNPHPDLFTQGGSSQIKTPLDTGNLHTSAFADKTSNNCPPGNNTVYNITDVVQEIVNHANWDPNTGGGRMGFSFERTAGKGSRHMLKAGNQLTISYSTSTVAQADNGDPIGEWDDLSGNGNNAVATHGNDPTRVDNQINGKSIVRFNNGDMLSALTSAQTGKREMTVFAVIKPNFSTSGSDGRIVSGTSSGATNDTTSGSSIIPLLRYGANTGFSNLYSGSASTYRTDYSCGAPCTSTPYLFTSVFSINTSNNTITSTLKGNGSQVNQRTGFNPSGSPYTFGIDQFYYGGTRSGAMPGGGTNYFNGDYAEIVIYNYALTCRQIESLEDYFRGKWALSATAYTSTCPADLVPVL
jgi:hypothetical protein